MKKLFIIFICLFNLAFSQSQFSDFLTRVYSTSNDSMKQYIVDSFWNYAKTQGIPFLEGTKANFIYRTQTPSNIYLSGDMNSWSSTADKLQKLSTTDLYYISKTYELDARLDYKFIINGNWILDPNNPKTCTGGYGPNSELAMPGYVQPQEIKVNPLAPKGRTINHTIFSTALNQNYAVTVYLPPSYDTNPELYFPSIYVQDGSEYINLGYMINVINNLIYENKIDEIIAVFITPNNRNDEYAGSKRTQYESFLVEQLRLFIDSTYRTMQGGCSRAIMGASFGGNISTFISYRNPQIFGAVGNHSPAFWPNNYEVQNMIINGPKKDIKIYMDWGTYESLWQPCRILRDTLLNRKYMLSWNEWHEGHSWGSWRAHTDNLLIHLFGKASNVKNESNLIYNYFLEQNYPNPFNAMTTINYNIPSTNKNEYVKIQIIDVFGRVLETLIDKYQSPGKYSINWDADNYPSGVYLYSLQIGEKTTKFYETKKMLLIK